MQSITVKADETLLKQIVEVSKALAKATNKSLIIDDNIAIELNRRANEVLQGKELINESEALSIFENIKKGTYAN
ncbi:hypothetical protein [Campylobacter hyointestinalis]|uniref:hypothetical protein n=1 Tax=Campylobacter hyointestinalis TaxID=198 RepID=UPI001BD519E3|nr:hypothetical protein [Campylobacter hyointestinalis]MBT0611392.1 hypothetical protein [Campylobacter hyointestinalis subsp. hyointestinalis]MDY2999831.1 hypothetical protein [Campylobacter hyointestinalis]